MNSNNVLRLSTAMPLLIGGLIYLTSRSDILLMFRITDWFGFSDLVADVKNCFKPFWNVMPAWTYLSLPNGLWTFSFSISYLFVWNNSKIYYWVSVVWVISILFEMLQIFGLIPGVFDLNDLTIIIFAILLSWLYIQRWLAAIDNYEIDQPYEHN